MHEWHGELLDNRLFICKTWRNVRGVPHIRLQVSASVLVTELRLLTNSRLDILYGTRHSAVFSGIFIPSA